jgi:predicted TIM-barrel fold metal-dependent hydrolase
MGVRGIGELHPILQNFELNDNFYQPFWDELKANNLPVVIHASEPVGHRYPGKGDLPADKLVDFINNNQNLKIICAHWGGGLIFYSLMPEINSILDNVFFDSAASNYLYDNRIFDIATRMMNSDKILFGSDFPIISQKAVLNSLNISITDELVKNKILGVNIGNLLKY